MALANRFDFGDQFDIEQTVFEAQKRWLRTQEICGILRNYKRFSIAPEPPNLPPSGSLFLFDRKVLRYFRKDGHNWRKKKDGKTIKEAHERLKVGSIDVLHCYYAHGEDNENFQRRSYWMLEEELSHIVLVHYREVKGYRTNCNRFKETEGPIVSALEVGELVCSSKVENSMILDVQQNSCQMLSQNTDSRTLNSGQASEYDDVESGRFHVKSTTRSSLEIDDDKSQKQQKELDLWGWEDALESHNARVQSASVTPSDFYAPTASVRVISKEQNMLAKHLLSDSLHENQAFRGLVQGQEVQQAMHTIDHLQIQSVIAGCEEGKSDVESNMTFEKLSNVFPAPRTRLDRPVKDKFLKKSDSFSQWMCNELGDVEPVMASSDAYWDSDEKSECPILSPRAELESYTLGTSLSQDQLFRIIEFAPNWGYACSETKVLITGMFLNTKPDVGKFQWSCMFGEVEVPAEVIADGVLRCHAPPHDVAKVSLYVTCSNRLCCSEVREFEYREKFIPADATTLRNRDDSLQIKFGKFLSLGSSSNPNNLFCRWDDNSDLHHEITSLLKGNDADWLQMLELTSKDIPLIDMKDKLAEELLKYKLSEWLLCKEAEGGIGTHALDENGLGVLHFAAALGYDWAISPVIAAGVSVNFRDVHGWTALHWAAYYGRERTVVYLVSLGASTGVLMDPTPTYPMGRTSADLASENGHKGIAGFLAESSLSSHLDCLTLKNKGKHDSFKITSVVPASERVATPVSAGDNLDGSSLKDSLAALCNAAHAAARILEVYRLHSFKMKQIRESGNDKIETLDEYAFSAVTMKSHKHGKHDEPVHAAAVRIQNKFRSWKGRREFVKFRQKVVNIQAHYRGYQVRKHYKKFVWSVGIMEKVILRWRRKRTGLRGFKSEFLTVKSDSEGQCSNEDEYDFFKEGRKQAEEMQQKALSRVKSMVRNPEARDQYRRLLTTVREIKEMKDGSNEAVEGENVTASMDDERIDLDS